MSIDVLKKQAKRLSRLLPDHLATYKEPASLNACQELAAKLNGYPSYHAAIASPRPELPLPTLPAGEDTDESAAPLALKVPNVDTRVVMADAYEIVSMRTADEFASLVPEKIRNTLQLPASAPLLGRLIHGFTGRADGYEFMRMTENGLAVSYSYLTEITDDPVETIGDMGRCGLIYTPPDRPGQTVCHLSIPDEKVEQACCIISNYGVKMLFGKEFLLERKNTPAIAVTREMRFNNLMRLPQVKTTFNRISAEWESSGGHSTVMKRLPDGVAVSCAWIAESIPDVSQLATAELLSFILLWTENPNPPQLIHQISLQEGEPPTDCIVFSRYGTNNLFKGYAKVRPPRPAPLDYAAFVPESVRNKLPNDDDVRMLGKVIRSCRVYLKDDASMCRMTPNGLAVSYAFLSDTFSCTGDWVRALNDARLIYASSFTPTRLVHKRPMPETGELKEVIIFSHSAVEQLWSGSMAASFSHQPIDTRQPLNNPDSKRF